MPCKQLIDYVNPAEYFDRFIETGITSSRFNNTGEIVREGFRFLAQREQEDTARIEWLRSAAKEGFYDMERGEVVTLNSWEEINAFVRKIRREVSVKHDFGQGRRACPAVDRAGSPNLGLAAVVLILCIVFVPSPALALIHSNIMRLRPLRLIEVARQLYRSELCTLRPIRSAA